MPFFYRMSRITSSTFNSLLSFSIHQGFFIAFRTSKYEELVFGLGALKNHQLLLLLLKPIIVINVKPTKVLITTPFECETRNCVIGEIETTLLYLRLLNNIIYVKTKIPNLHNRKNIPHSLLLLNNIEISIFPIRNFILL